MGAPAGAKPINPGATPDTVTDVTLHSDAATGVIAPTPLVYLVFWGSQWSKDPAKAAPARRSRSNRGAS